MTTQGSVSNCSLLLQKSRKREKRRLEIPDIWPQSVTQAGSSENRALRVASEQCQSDMAQDGSGKDTIDRG